MHYIFIKKSIITLLYNKGRSVENEFTGVQTLRVINTSTFVVDVICPANHNKGGKRFIYNQPNHYIMCHIVQ